MHICTLQKTHSVLFRICFFHALDCVIGDSIRGEWWAAGSCRLSMTLPKIYP